MITTKPATVSEMVRSDYRTADVFKKWGINYCCGGNLPLEEVCQLQQLDKAAVEKDLKKATQSIAISNNLRFDEWPVDFLVDYISYVHHAYLKETVPSLTQNLHSFIQGHKKKFPDLEQVEEVFTDLKEELMEHVEKEDSTIFPYLKQISNTYKRKEIYGSLFVRTMSKPLTQVVESEHRRIAILLTQLREVTNHYHFPNHACTNHQVIYHKLREFDADLVQHKHLENNILFPKAMAMEKELLH
ncbi:MAG: DUF542 domain-containing protein [Flavisolibacter sp.]|nr:DUF542 domain-containing protein [Flavisolibacter sp.]